MSEDSSYRLIPLTRGLVCKVDADDYEALSKWKWYAGRRSDGRAFYARRNAYTIDRKRRTCIFMSREIMGFPLGMQVDHINLDTLDNRRANLRICTSFQNACNHPMRSDNSSGFKGVSYHKNVKRWIARIGVNGKLIQLGCYSSPEEAHKSYIAAAAQVHGDFARW